MESPWGRVHSGTGGGEPGFSARPLRASGAEIRFRPLPRVLALTGSSRALPGQDRESGPHFGLWGLDFKIYIHKTYLPLGYESVPKPIPNRR